MICICRIESTPLGPIWIAATERGLVAVQRQGSEEEFRRSFRRRFPPSTPVVWDDNVEAARQILAYLRGERKELDLPIDWTGLTSFQRAVFAATMSIRPGQAATYGEVARWVGRPRAARAVGRAMASNPVALVIPCHRVIGADGGLHGYGGPGGLDAKAWLLKLEGAEFHDPRDETESIKSQDALL